MKISNLLLEPQAKDLDARAREKQEIGPLLVKLAHFTSLTAQLSFTPRNREVLLQTQLNIAYTVAALIENGVDPSVVLLTLQQAFVQTSNEILALETEFEEDQASEMELPTVSPQHPPTQ